MKDKLKNLLFILILGSVSAGVLLWIRDYTAPIIEKYQETQLKMTIMNAANVSYDETDVDAKFKENIRTESGDGLDYYLSPDNDYIFEFKGRGLWGMIEGVLSLKPDMETLANIQIISQEETPGLGGRIGELQYLDSFKGKKADPKLILAARKKATEDDEIDAITGATISSQALVDSVNDSIIDFRKAVKR